MFQRGQSLRGGNAPVVTGELNRPTTVCKHRTEDTFVPLSGEGDLPINEKPLMLLKLYMDSLNGCLGSCHTRRKDSVS